MDTNELDATLERIGREVYGIDIHRDNVYVIRLHLPLVEFHFPVQRKPPFTEATWGESPEIEIDKITLRPTEQAPGVYTAYNREINALVFYTGERCMMA